MKEWIFKVYIYYVEGKPINEINDWIEGLNKQNRARVKRIIAHLETQKDMRSKYFSSYKNHAYIYRLKFRFHKELYRLFGCFGPGENEFTLLIPVDKKAGRLIPSNAVEIAETRFKLIHEDRRYVDDLA